MMDDPTKPYKMYAALISVAASTILTTALDLPQWAVVVLTVIVACAAVYLTPNPQVEAKKDRTIKPDSEPLRRKSYGFDDPVLFDYQPPAKQP